MHKLRVSHSLLGAASFEGLGCHRVALAEEVLARVDVLAGMRQAGKTRMYEIGVVD